MSLTLDDVVRPDAGKTLTPEQIAWNLRIFSHLGWQSKKPAQQQMQAQMKVACAAVDRSVLQPGVGPDCAAQLEQEKLKAGKEFKAFQVALTYFEQASPDARIGMADQLRGAAQAYLDHWAKHSKREKAQSETKRKKQVCEDTLAGLRKIDLSVQLRRLGDPPWNSALAMQAASLKASLDFESVPDAQAELVGGVHAYPAFWVNSKPPPQQGNNPVGQQTKQKSFLFKPMATDSAVPGFPAGGDTAREAMAGRMGDLLAGMTGLNFGIPETHVVSVGREKLPPQALDPNKVAGAEVPGAPLVGSLQQFARADGGAREQPIAALENVPPKACQKIMILDMMSLNMDRHGDNVMMQTPPGGAPDLVPIDHGLTFPPPNADILEEMPKKIGAGFNALLAMPGSHEPFTDEMLEAIEAIDPDTMAVGLRREMALLEKQHGQTKGKLTSDAIEMSRRSTLFLKKGAAFDPPLSPAAIQVALGQYAAELLDPAVAETDFERRADDILADIAAQQEDLKELFLMPMEQQGEMRLGLVANGWYDSFSIESWINKNPKLALKIYKADLKEPSKMRELVALLGQNVVDQQLQTLSVEQLFAKRTQFLAVPPSNDITPQITRDAAAFTQAFPNDYGTLDDQNIVLRRAEGWRRMEALGGFASLDDALETIKASPAQAEAARRQPSECLKVLSTAASMPLAQQAVDQIADLDARGVRRGIAYLDRVLAEVPQGHQVLTDAAQFKSNPVTGSKQQSEELRLLTIEAMDAVRADVGPRLNVVAKRIETRIDDTDDEDAAERLGRQLESVGRARAAIMAGGVAGAQATATTWEQRFPN